MIDNREGMHAAELKLVTVDSAFAELCRTPVTRHFFLGRFSLQLDLLSIILHGI